MDAVWNRCDAAPSALIALSPRSVLPLVEWTLSGCVLYTCDELKKGRGAIDTVQGTLKCA